jgi:signal transduction histidine kinase
MGGITVRCKNTESIVYIDIVDTGTGIPERELERIFEPFIQVNRSLTQTSNEGVGLGLAISRQLARAMSGDITVRSTLDHGSAFSLALPRAPEPLA